MILKPCEIQAATTVSSSGAAPCQEDHAAMNEQRRIFTVADGFGGVKAGAEAARKACESVLHFLEREAGDLEATLPFELRANYSLAGNVLFNSFVHANREIIQYNDGRGIHDRGGASMVAGYLEGNRMVLANLGVCSAWMIRGCRSVELVTPRSYGRMLDPFGTDTGPTTDIPMAALGMSEDLEPEVIEVIAQPGDWYLFQTHGITSDFRETLSQLQGHGLSIQDLYQKLSAEMQGAGFAQNATFSLVILKG
ncbi:MAG: PP2C family serine/threonine-protein phosphatase [Bacteriovoracia bacterium]